jgi:hypothetical protein
MALVVCLNLKLKVSSISSHMHEITSSNSQAWRQGGKK